MWPPNWIKDYASLTQYQHRKKWIDIEVTMTAELLSPPNWIKDYASLTQYQHRKKWIDIEVTMSAELLSEPEAEKQSSAKYDTKRHDAKTLEQRQQGLKP
uniref:Neur_chan_LBD domain-containing protein n=1 Tax=Steinernema glaseri TaxID=37863 RepID=A0A1I7YM08_9BILA